MKIEANRAALETKAIDAGLPLYQARDYAKANKEATPEIAQKELENLVKPYVFRTYLENEAIKAGLSPSLAKQYAEENKTADVETAKSALDKLAAINDDLVKQAKAIGLSDEDAQQFAINNIHTDEKDISAALDKALKTATYSKYDQGYSETATEYTESSQVSSATIDGIGELKYGQETKHFSNNRIYNQPYSAAILSDSSYENITYNGKEQQKSVIYSGKTAYASGLETRYDHISTIGKAAYTGKALTDAKDETGLANFSYVIDFDQRKGYGEITGQENFGDIQLKEADLELKSPQGPYDSSKVGINGSMFASKRTKWGHYSLYLFGPRAEEVAGSGSFGSNYNPYGIPSETINIAFAGQKNEAELLKVNAKFEKSALEQVKIERANAESRIQAEGGGYARPSITQIYEQPYSVVIGTTREFTYEDDPYGMGIESTIVGFATPDRLIPTAGKATYLGKAIRSEDTFGFSYNVDFDKRIGSGEISNISNYGGKIQLQEGAFTKLDLNYDKTNIMGIQAQAMATDGTTGNYKLGFFGTAAQEVAGEVKMNPPYDPNCAGSINIGFAGKRGEIK